MLALLHAAMYIICSIVLFIQGSSGDKFSGLSDGPHTINVRFTPDGLTQVLQLRLPFRIGNNDNSSHKTLKVVCDRYLMSCGWY